MHVLSKHIGHHAPSRAQETPPVARPPRRGGFLWRASLLALLLLSAPGAYAAVTSALVQTGTAQAPTGSTPLCSLDPATADLNVCTNDTLIYNIEYVTDGGDSALTIVSTLPTCTAATPGCPANGIMAVFESLPPQCDGPGSGISANGLTLTCVRNGPINAGTARILPIVRVLGTTPNGASIPTPVTTATTPETAAPIAATTPSGPVTVRAAPAFDLLKSPQDQGSLGLKWAKGPDGVTDGWVMVFAAGVRVPGGTRGIELLDANGISWQDVIGNITVTGTNALGTANAAAVQTALRANAVLLPVTTPGGPNACFDNGSDASDWRFNIGMPTGRGGPSTSRLQTSGVCAVTQAGGAGGTVSARITGALWGNSFYPSLANGLSPLPPGDNYVSAKEIAVWIPASVISILPNSASIRITNTYSSVQGASISGQPVVQPNTANDTAIINFTNLVGLGIAKYWQNYNGANDLQISGSHTQDGIVIDGMPAIARTYINNTGSQPLLGATQCEKIDNSKYQAFGDATFISSYATNPPLLASDYIIEYGTGGINGVGEGWASLDDYAFANCANNQSPAWYTSRAAVPGGDTAITKVRMRFLVPMVPGTSYNMSVPVRISSTSPVNAMGVSAGYVWPLGTRINNWNAGTYTGATSSTWSTNINNPDSNGQGWLVGGTGATAYTAAGMTQRTIGDTITLAGASATVTKETSTPANDATQALGGQPITYVIKPVLSSAIATPLTSDMTVRDVLPPGLSYVAGSASLTPVIQNNTPSTGYTTLSWTLNNIAVGAAITPITFQALVDVTLSNGTYIPNFTVVSSPLDTRTCQASGGAYDGILNTGYTVDTNTGNVTGALCVHATRRDLRVSNPGGFQVNKTVITPQVEPNQPISYNLSWISVGNDLDSSDLIDVLPYNGDSRASNFTGASQLVGPLGPVGNDGATPSVIYYTSAAAGSVNADPNAASNALPGIWCTDAQIGSAGCPASYAQTTAIRVVSSAMQPENVQRSVVVRLNQTGNVVGNAYRNTFVIRGVTGGVPLTAAVNSPVAQAVVVTGSLAGQVFRDDNDDGVLNNTDVGIAGVDVTLAGCSAGADGIVQTTAIPQTGVPVCAGDDQLVTSTIQTIADGTYSFTNQVSGLYRITEAQPAGYDDGKRNIGNLGGTANAQGTVPSVITDIVLPIGTGGTDYDFAEIRANPTLTLVKTVTNDNGGAAAVGDFTLTATGPSTITGITGATTVTNAPVPAGTYALTETNLPGYVAGDYSCVVNGAAAVSGNSLVLVAGDEATCTINNDDQAATLTLVKTVTNDNGGSAVVGDFTLTATGPSTITGVTGDTAITTATVGAGTYALTETNLPGYTAGTYSCVVNNAAAVSGTSLTLAGGDVATCTVNNDDQATQLTLVKTVTNGNGGTAVVGDFTLTATGPTTITGVTGAAGVTNAPVTPGTYALTETNLPGYTAGAWTCTAGTLSGNSLTLANGQNATCTINNTDQPVSLTLVKAVTNDDGGTATAADFPLTATGPVTITGVTGSTAVTNAAVQTGTYVLSEANLPGYTAGAWSCSAGTLTGNSLVLSSGQNVTCTIVNDDQPAILTLVKTVTNDNGGTAVVGDFTLTATGATTITGVTGAAAVTNASVTAGAYALSETNLPGYLGSAYSCVIDNGAPVSGNNVVLTSGANAVCTINNDDQGATLTLVKTVTNDNGGTAVVGDFPLTAKGPSTVTGTTGAVEVTNALVQPGTYALTETNRPGYTAGDYSCTINGGAGVSGNSVTVANGDAVVCTINNDDQAATLTLVKTVTNDNGGVAVVGDFALTATGPITLTGVTGEAAVTNAAVGPGTYALTEANVAGYTAGEYSCVVNDAAAVSGNSVTLTNGDIATCTINNDDQPAVLTIDKSVVGAPQLVAGTADEFVVQYAITVTHESGSAGVYDLIDTPQFDSDTTVLGVTATRNDAAMTGLTGAGPWTLATAQGIAIGATDTYVLDVHVRVAAGSSQNNDVCLGNTAGNGLFNLAAMTLAGEQTQDAACADTPKPVVTTVLAIEKTGSTREAEVGDLVNYSIRIRNNGQGIAILPTLVDRLPAGFRLVDDTARVRGATLVSLEGAPGPVLRLTLDRINPGAEVTVVYRVRIGVGAQEGDGINRAQVECRDSSAATATTPCSNESTWEVDIDAGVFAEEGCIAGQVFVDCNYNSAKDGEELGIPGVRMYLEDGTYLISDSEGKYSYCGVRPVTHVLKVDQITLPTRSRLVTSSSRNTGDAGSVFIDMKKGELHRADFIEGSCNNEVIEQVKARKATGEVSSVQTETGQPKLKLQDKPVPQSNPPQQGTDSSNQPIERVRYQDVPAANDDDATAPKTGTDGG